MSACVTFSTCKVYTEHAGTPATETGKTSDSNIMTDPLGLKIV